MQWLSFLATEELALEDLARIFASVSRTWDDAMTAAEGEMFYGAYVTDEEAHA